MPNKRTSSSRTKLGRPRMARRKGLTTAQNKRKGTKKSGTRC